MAKGKIKSFVKETIARMKGDTPTVVAEKNYRMASSGIESQLASLKARQVRAENEVEEATDELRRTKYPEDMIVNTDQYIQNVAEKNQILENKKEELENIQKSIDFFKNLKDEYDSEEAEETK